MCIFVQLTSKLALGHNQPHVECVSGALSPHKVGRVPRLRMTDVTPLLSPQGRGRGTDVDHSMCLAVRLRMNGAIPLLPPSGLHFMDLTGLLSSV
jgi:hypothetical protein